MPPSRKRSSPRLPRLGTILLGVLIGLTLVLSLLPFVSFHRVTDYLTGFRFLYLVLSILLGGAALGLWIRKRSGPRLALAGAAALALLVNWLAIRPYYHPPPSEPADEDLTWSLRLLSFNVRHRNENFDEVLAFVRAEEPDLAIFQEATGPWPGRLAALEAEMPHRFSVPSLHLEVFSRIPVLDHEVRRSGRIRGDLRLTLAGGLDLLACHAYPWNAYGTQGYAWRNEHLLDRLGTDLAGHPRPLVVMGDLNASLWSPVYRAMRERSGLVDARLGFGPLATQSICGWHQLLGIPIDHCLVSRDIYVYDFRTGPPLGSDHLPVIVDIAF